MTIAACPSEMGALFGMKMNRSIKDAIGALLTIIAVLGLALLIRNC